MKTTLYRIQWGYTDGGAGGWWFLGILCGATFALGLPAFLEVWRYILMAMAVLLCLSSPLLGVYVTRAVTKYLATKKRKTKLRGPLYADYAYIL